MARSTKITIHGTHFETRTALRAHLRRIRARWHGKGAVTGRDSDFLLELFAYHPEAQSIARDGVSHFEVHLAPQRAEGVTPRLCLWAVTAVGAVVPVSMAPAVKAAYLVMTPPPARKRQQRARIAQLAGSAHTKGPL